MNLLLEKIKIQDRLHRQLEQFRRDNRYINKLIDIYRRRDLGRPDHLYPEDVMAL